MKGMISAATMTLACLSVISTGLVVGTSSNLKAAAGEVCALTPNPAVTGGDIQKRIDDIARCNTRHHQQQMVEISHPVKKTMPEQVNPPTVNSQRVTPNYPAYCGQLPSGVKPGDALYSAFLYRCQYGD